jgi:hypothetical protein
MQSPLSQAVITPHGLPTVHLSPDCIQQDSLCSEISVNLK